MHFKLIRNQFRKILRLLPLSRKLDGILGIKLLGYKHFVGGMWDAVGHLQYEFLLSEGLLPGHRLLDIGCGSLRGGRFLISYLEPGNYMGLDKEKSLIEAGLKHEIPKGLILEKNPEFAVSENFDFSHFRHKPDYAIAQSLFTHLCRKDILQCLKQLRNHVSHCRFYATFFEGESGANPKTSHSLNPFFYNKDEMQAFADDSNWSFRYLGNWNHPRGQIIVEYRC